MTPVTDRAARLAAEAAGAARRRDALRTLLLDLDGTLAPIVPRPEEARVPAATLQSLRDLKRIGWRIAIVSGRPAAQVRPMVPVKGIRIFGSHGLEGSWRGGRVPGTPVAVSERLQRILAEGRRLARGIPEALVEAKPAGVGFHDRRISRPQLFLWRRRGKGLLAASDLEGLEILRGRRVVEIRPRGSSKGFAVETLPGLGSRTEMDGSLLVLGDDRTDEDMFKALRGRGLGVLVGRKRKGTAARRRLASPAAVQRFLILLAGAS
jgi:trehalose 6-phosphate phosphatase